MKRLFILMFIVPFSLPGQDATIDKVKIKLVANSQPLPGASLRIKGSNLPLETNTDLNGEAQLVIPKEFKIVEISIIGPYTTLEIIRPVDSIYFDISTKTATYFLDKKRMKRKKQVVRGY